VLLGDSHAGMFAQTLNNITLENNYNLIQITADGTYPMKDSEGILNGSIDYFNYIFESYLPGNYKKIDLVVINSNYAAYPKEKLEKKIKFSKECFAKYKIPILFIGQTKVYPIDFPTFYYLKNNYHVNYPHEKVFFENTTKINSYLKENIGLRYINLLDLNVEQLSSKEHPYLYDRNHLTYFGTEQYRRIIEEMILNSSLHSTNKCNAV
jgi:predicted nucleotidyltransferase